MPPSADDQQTAKDLDTIARAVGLVVLQWGQAEQSLDLLVALLWQSFDGKRYAKKIPMMLEPKIKFVRTCMESDAKLNAFQVKSGVLLSKFSELSSLRHDMIHGAVTSISTIDDSFVFAKLDIRDGFHYHREVRVSASEYPKIVDRLVELGRLAHELTSEVFVLVKDDDSFLK